MYVLHVSFKSVALCKSVRLSYLNKGNLLTYLLTLNTGKEQWPTLR